MTFHLGELRRNCPAFRKLQQRYSEFTEITIFYMRCKEIIK